MIISSDHIIIQELPESTRFAKTRLAQSGELEFDRGGQWCRAVFKDSGARVHQISQLMMTGGRCKPAIPVLHSRCPGFFLRIFVMKLGNPFLAWIAIIKSLMIGVHE